MSNEFVVDCSVAMAWYLVDESNTFADEVLDLLKTHSPIVPDLFFLEAANTFLSAHRRRRITAAQLNSCFANLLQLPITIDHGCSRGFLPDVFSLAQKHDLSVYDAAYLELALRESLPLATQDAPLMKAAKASGAKLLRA